MAFFVPDDYLTSVTCINPEMLIEQGYSIVLLDVDNTLVPRDTHELSPEVRSWVARLGELGLRACLLSNNWHKVVFGYAEALNLPIVYKAMKPLPFAYLRALRKTDKQKGEKVLVVGDQLMTDVLGAHALGHTAILVAPQTTKDLWHTVFLRRFERLLMKDMKPHD